MYVNRLQSPSGGVVEAFLIAFGLRKIYLFSNSYSLKEPRTTDLLPCSEESFQSLFPETSKRSFLNQEKKGKQHFLINAGALPELCLEGRNLSKTRINVTPSDATSS